MSRSYVTVNYHLMHGVWLTKKESIFFIIKICGSRISGPSPKQSTSWHTAPLCVLKPPTGR